MGINLANFKRVHNYTENKNVVLVAVSKIKPVSDIKALYEHGQRDFGENYVQEMVEKAASLPDDIRWHFIGHLQSNKVKYIAPFVHLIQSVDSEKLLYEINKQAKKHDRIIPCLLQVHIAQEKTKFGLSVTEAQDLVATVQQNEAEFSHIRLNGLMGMASFTDDQQLLKKEFDALASVYKKISSLYPDFNILSMGMSGDYEIAVQHGSNMIRVGSILFGARQ